MLGLLHRSHQVCCARVLLLAWLITHTEHSKAVGQSHATVSSLGSSADAAPLSSYDIASLQHYKSRVGPELRQMRRAQGASRLELYRAHHHLLCSSIATLEHTRLHAYVVRLLNALHNGTETKLT